MALSFTEGLIPYAYDTKDIPAAHRDFDFKREIELWSRMKERGVLLGVREKIKKVETRNVQFVTYVEDSWYQNHVILNGNHANTDTELTVTGNATRAVLGSILYNVNKKEQRYCTETPTTSTTIKCTASTAVNGDVALSQWDDADTVIIVGNTLANNQRDTDMRTVEAASISNRRRYFHRRFALDENTRFENPRTGDKYTELRRRAEQMIADDMDWGGFFGKGFEISDSQFGAHRVGSVGLVDQIIANAPAENVNESITDLTAESMVEAIIRPARRFSAEGTTIALCGSGALISLQKALLRSGSTQIQMGKANTWGFSLKTLESVVGNLQLMRYTPFDELANGFFTNHILCIDFADVYIRHAPGYANVKFQKYQQTNPRVEEWEYVANEAYEIREPRRHSFFQIDSVKA